jgi:hypothetical protein
MPSTKKRKAVHQLDNIHTYIKIPNVIYCEKMRSEIRLDNESVFLHGSMYWGQNTLVIIFLSLQKKNVNQALTPS